MNNKLSLKNYSLLNFIGGLTLKTIINTIQSKLEENVVFNIYKLTPFLESIINTLNKDKGNSYVIATDLSENKQTKLYYYDIYYLEYLNRKVFVYTVKNVYEIKESLYKLERQLPNYFVRCSKSMIVNINEIKDFSSTLNGNLTANLLNNENIIISRRYVKAIKETFSSI